MCAVPQHPANAQTAGKSTRAWGKCWGREASVLVSGPPQG